MINFHSDIYFVLRLFFKQWGSSALGILILGLGFGVSITMYALVNGVLHTDPPFSNSNDVLKAVHYRAKSITNDMKLRVFQEIYHHSKSFKHVVSYQRDHVTLSRGSVGDENHASSLVSWNFFDVVNAKPFLGRTFTKSDLHPSNGVVAVITYSLWHAQLSGRYDILNSKISLDGVPVKVIGIMPEDFEYPFKQQIWVLSDFGLTYSAGKYTASSSVVPLCMLKDSVSKAEATHELRSILDGLEDKYPEFKNHTIEVSLQPFESIRSFRKEIESMLYALLLFSLLLLAVAGSSISNLVMVRISRRQHELVTRKALGASASHIVFQVLLEGAYFCIAGLVCGAVVFYSCREYCWYVFTQAYLGTPIWWHIDPDWKVFLFSIALVILCIVISCIKPAIRTLSAEVNQILKDESRSATWLFMGKFIKQIVTFQITGSTVLIIVTLMILLISYYVLSWRLPYDPERILGVRLHMKQQSGFKTADDVYNYLDDIQTKIKALPGVQNTGFTTMGRGITPQNRPIKIEQHANNDNLPKIGTAVIYGNLLEMYGIKPLQGRFFNASDTLTAQKVAIVNQHFVDTFFKNEDPLGKRIQVKSPRLRSDEENKRNKGWTKWLTIVGIAPNLQRSLLPGQSSLDQAQIYIPASQLTSRFFTLLVTTKDKNAVGLVPRIVMLMKEDFPLLEVHHGSTVQSAVIAISRMHYILSAIITFFGSIALLITIVGLLGLIMFATLQRRREFGIRSALGADSKQVLLMVYKQSLWQIITGLLLGIIIAISVTAYVKENMKAMAFPVETPSFLIGIAICLLACIVAIGIPALRATKIHPSEVLRVD